VLARQGDATPWTSCATGAIGGRAPGAWRCVPCAAPATSTSAGSEASTGSSRRRTPGPASGGRRRGCSAAATPSRSCGRSCALWRRAGVGRCCGQEREGGGRGSEAWGHAAGEHQRGCGHGSPDQARLTLADGAFVASAAEGVDAGIGKDMLANVGHLTVPLLSVSIILTVNLILVVEKLL
jgi:hypothetical protein